MSEQAPKSNRSYSDILKLNQEVVQNLQGLIQEHDARKKELDELK